MRFSFHSFFRTVMRLNIEQSMHAARPCVIVSQCFCCFDIVTTQWRALFFAPAFLFFIFEKKKNSQDFFGNVRHDIFVIEKYPFM